MPCFAAILAAEQPAVDDSNTQAHLPAVSTTDHATNHAAILAAEPAAVKHTVISAIASSHQPTLVAALTHAVVTAYMQAFPSTLCTTIGKICSIFPLVVSTASLFYVDIYVHMYVCLVPNSICCDK